MNSRVLTVGVLLLLIGGCSLVGSFIVQDRLSQVPQMTGDQLARNGPPADGQVTLTDLRPCSRGVVAARVDHSLDLYVPAYPAGLGQEPPPADLGFLFQVWDDDERERLLGEPGPVEMTCWVHKGVQVMKISRGPGQIEEWAWDGLQKKYPGIRLDNNIWVLTVGHGHTPTAMRARSSWRYAIAELLLGAAVLGGAAFFKWRRVDTSSVFEPGVPPASEQA
ncbi:hypothetical protein AYO44_05715 [Planctomycetaceae bacterium SCGC AG-212-F19]|nr:hypothetical protein AYO44_05715 [Planctomycetaceae bacterium SCGC AG-212-F19]